MNKFGAVFEATINATICNKCSNRYKQEEGKHLLGIGKVNLRFRVVGASNRYSIFVVRSAVRSRSGCCLSAERRGGTRQLWGALGGTNKTRKWECDDSSCRIDIQRRFIMARCAMHGIRIVA